MTKDIIWDSNSLSKALGRDIYVNVNAKNICYTSCDITEGDIFVALPGINNHGAYYIDDAFKRGASCAISERPQDDKRVIIVDDSYKALNKLAEFKRKNSSAKFIAITGSAGKTSTKEILKTILSSFGKTYANKDSYNNHTGVPLSLASLAEDINFSVNEIGMNNAGEIRNLAKIVIPDMVIITNIYEAHIGGEGLGSLENICKAKCEIFEALSKEGCAILNIDNPMVNMQSTILKDLGINKIYTFGESNKADSQVLNYERIDNYAVVTYRIFNKTYRTKNYLIGKHQASNFAAAFLVPYILELDMDEVMNASENVMPYDGRGVISEHKYNGYVYRVIDDAYNANPASVEAALKNLAEIQGVKVAILADMRELGDNSIEMHKILANSVLKAGVTQIFTLCDHMKYLHDKLSSQIDSYHYDDTSDRSFDDIISKLIKTDATILVKGSKGTKLKRFVEYFPKFIKNIK